ncbi:uncharacterized protein Tco025E_05236 [Trypanosoma conorhini]|uniref:Uncharacterized protein n=1 Tax=Trypanosoma conorhini TaxID=83891 RepID=A0A422PEV6_9TRYP|nr:uncharacterized protein Tco025E_05236 [Trypanosoma conorhini]RNF16255.1 hypothetical protein Tco025E_05236 [Trypanosoma conorhini]
MNSDAATQMEPRVIALSPLFLGLLRAGQTAAYALRPCFATRLDVYSGSTGPEGSWVPCALLISQRGQLYLFSADDGRVINAALLGPATDTGADTARVDVVTQRVLGPDFDMQSLYMRCRQPLHLVGPRETGERGGGSTARRSEAVAEGDAAPSTVFPPFSYLMRFHCRNAPVVLQLIRIVTAFADPKKGEIFLQQAQVSLKEEFNHSIFIDPVATTPGRQDQAHRQGDSHTWRSALRNVSPLKALGFSPRAKGVVNMRDVARAAKKRLLDAGERIEIPPPLDSAAPLRPYSMAEFNEANGVMSNARDQVSLGGGIAADRQTRASALQAKCGGTVDAASPAISQFYAAIMGRMSHFTISSSEDLLHMCGLPAFEVQFAVFLAQRHIQDLVEACAGQLLAAFPNVPNLPQYRILAREAVREELRWKFGVTYRELCSAARARIDCTSVPQLLLEEERASTQRPHEEAIQALLAEYAARRQTMLEDEASVFFGSNHEPKLAETGQPLAPLCAEETAEWRKAVVEAAEALQALERGIRRIRDSVSCDSDDNSDEDAGKKEDAGNVMGGSVTAVSSRRRRNETAARFVSVQDEAAFLLQRIQRKAGNAFFAATAELQRGSVGKGLGGGRCGTGGDAIGVQSAAHSTAAAD